MYFICVDGTNQRTLSVDEVRELLFPGGVKLEHNALGGLEGGVNGQFNHVGRDTLAVITRYADNARLGLMSPQMVQRLEALEKKVAELRM